MLSIRYREEIPQKSGWNKKMIQEYYRFVSIFILSITEFSSQNEFNFPIEMMESVLSFLILGQFFTKAFLVSLSDLKGADLKGAYLRYADLRYANLEGVLGL